MTKITKSAKKAKMIKEKVVVERIYYVCPSCHTNVTGHIGKDIVRWKCLHCEQLLEWEK